MGKSLRVIFIYAVLLLMWCLPARVSAASLDTYRVYETVTGEHLYTQDANERDALIRQGWKDEGIAFAAPQSGIPVYRVFDPHPGMGQHHYTMDRNEVDYLVSVGWIDEGTAWYSDSERVMPVYRLFNGRNTSVACHHYTADQNERDVLIALYGWTDEGIAWYGTTPSEDNTNSGEDPDGQVTPEPTPVPTLQDHIEEIQWMLPAGNGTWSVYAAQLSSGEEASISSRPMQAASLIKLFIMGAVYENYSALISSYGESAVERYLYDMITISDNDAANALTVWLGGGSAARGRQMVNDFCRRYGYTSTSMSRMLEESMENGDNYTSVADCGHFLREVYRGVNGEGSRLVGCASMFQLLSEQQRRNKIPALLPSGVQAANKTGELKTVENDAAILYNTAKGVDLILVFQSEEVRDTDAACLTIASLSRRIYSYYNE